jgi:hypothetical protein
MNASVLLELAREWSDIADIAQRSSVSMAALGMPMTEPNEALAIARRALDLAGKLEQLAKAAERD